MPGDLRDQDPSSVGLDDKLHPEKAFPGTPNKSPSPPVRTQPDLSNSVRWALAIGCAVIVANLYYVQPLLGQIQRDFHITVSQASLAAMLCQIGYALGMVFVVPLGDSLERRGLILLTIVASGVVCLAVSLAPSVPLLLSACLVLGLVSCTPQLLVPLASHLAPEGSKGKTVGFVMSGLLIGILLARTYSGFVGDKFGWRAVYLSASFLMAGLFFWIRTVLPEVPPEVDRVSYIKLLGSLGKLFRSFPVLQESAFFGSLGFLAFSAFWTTLSFLMQSAPYNLAPKLAGNAAGLFGLVGAGGALAAGVFGKLGDRGSARMASALALLLLLLSWVVLFLGRGSIAMLVLGTLFLDIGTQGNHISCQTRVFSLLPSARSRLNTVYMTIYFLGGSTGSILGGWAWTAYGWNGVCLTGALACITALSIHLFHRARQAREVVSPTI